MAAKTNEQERKTMIIEAAAALATLMNEGETLFFDFVQEPKVQIVNTEPKHRYLVIMRPERMHNVGGMLAV